MMNKLKGGFSRLLAVTVAFASVMQVTIPAAFADTAEDAEAAIAGEAAGYASDSGSVKSGYGLNEYTANNNEVLVLYRDGNVTVFSYDSEEELSEALARFEADDAVELYQPNFVYTDESWNGYVPAMPNGNGLTQDEYSYLQWAYSNNGVDINVSEAWANYVPAKNAIVAIVDTGIDYNNAEIADSIWVNGGEIPDNGVDDDGNGYIDDVYGWNFYNNNNQIYQGAEDSHGTHGAGTITAAANNGIGIAGIADYENIRVMAVKALGGDEGYGSTMSLMLAIRYAEENGADICNLSLGTDINDRMLYRVMQNSDMLFVIAAGNSVRGKNNDYFPTYPASYDLDNIISVANVTADGRLNPSSDYGAASVDLAAPGTDIVGISTDGTYEYMSGTSMSAPMVAAAAALVYTSTEAMTLDQTKNIILNNVTKLDSLSGRVASGGMLNVGAAVAYAVAYGGEGVAAEYTSGEVIENTDYYGWNSGIDGGEWIDDEWIDSGWIDGGWHGGPHDGNVRHISGDLNNGSDGSTAGSWDVWYIGGDNGWNAGNFGDMGDVLRWLEEYINARFPGFII